MKGKNCEVKIDGLKEKKRFGKVVAGPIGTELLEKWKYVCTFGNMIKESAEAVPLRGRFPRRERRKYFHKILCDDAFEETTIELSIQ